MVIKRSFVPIRLPARLRSTKFTSTKIFRSMKPKWQSSERAKTRSGKYTHHRDERRLTLASAVVLPPHGPPVSTILCTGAGGAIEFISAAVRLRRYSSCGAGPPEFDRSRRVDSSVEAKGEGVEVLLEVGLPGGLPPPLPPAVVIILVGISYSSPIFSFSLVGGGEKMIP
jgi:hypothetical protein